MKSILRKMISSMLIVVIIYSCVYTSLVVLATSGDTIDCSINLSDLTYAKSSDSSSDIKTYELDDYDTFVDDFNNNNLPEIYITNFLYDGVSSVKSPDLDDFIENDSNDTKIKTLEIRVININTTGNIALSGTTTGTMIAVNTNNVTKDINLILNNVNIDTDSKKAPAIFVYNKETTYTGCKVTIKTIAGTKNYINGGKLKKVSLLGSDELSNYTSNYSGDALINYNKYTSYYGIYTSSQIENVLFAKVKADSEDLQDGDPLYFYKGSGAISSDIDLYFEGEGYLEVSSKGKEGIETKGNLTLSGGTGDYAVYAYDDCLNTTTASSQGTSVRNDMVIDVNSLIAIVNDEGDEGDAIDSNGSLTINGGTIYAFAHSTSQDDGLDSSNGTYINGGTVIATGNMGDEINSSSSQEFIKLNFKEQQPADTLVVLTDTDNNPVMAFKSSKKFTTLTYSSDKLKQTTYYVYKNGDIEGTENNGLYTNITSYTNGTKQQYSGGMGGNNPGGDNQTPPDGNNSGDGNTTPPEKPDGDGTNPGDNNQTTPDGNTTPPDKPDGENSNNGENSNGGGNNNSTTSVTYSAENEITSDTTLTSGTYSSSTADKIALMLSGNITANLSNISVNKTGSSSGGDNCNFYGINSAILARLGAKLTLKNATINTSATGANGVFSYGGSATTNNSSSDGTTVTISDSTITTTGDNAGGIMTTGGGTTIASNLTINTAGTSSAAIRTDRGGGTVTVDGGTYKTTGQGSPAIYSTANVTASNCDLTAEASEGIVIEGANTVTINNANLTDTNNKLNGQSTTYKNVFLYQSVSGDASEGTATFTAKDSTITTNNGDSFYVTNTTAVINLTNNTITNNDSTGNLLRAKADSWGNSGSNGGAVTLNADNQKLNGTIVIDNISTLLMNLKNSSSYEGIINSDNSAKKISLILDSTSNVKLSGDSYITAISDADTTFSNIDLNGYTLYVNGTAYTNASDLTSANSDVTIDNSSNNGNNNNNNNIPNNNNNNEMNNNSASSADFTLTSSTHTFNNVTDYVENNNADTNKENNDSNESNNKDATEDNKNNSNDNTNSNEDQNTNGSTNSNNDNSDSESTNSSNTDNTSSKDNTASTTTLPYTGEKDNLVIKSLIITMIIASIIFYVKYKKLDF